MKGTNKMRELILATCRAEALDKAKNKYRYIDAEVKLVPNKGQKLKLQRSSPKASVVITEKRNNRRHISMSICPLQRPEGDRCSPLPLISQRSPARPITGLCDANGRHATVMTILSETSSESSSPRKRCTLLNIKRRAQRGAPAHQPVSTITTPANGRTPSRDGGYRA